MADPTKAVRAAVMDRDGSMCVACAIYGPMTFQHRQASGMGGNPVRPGYADGLAACGPCNARFESDLQSKALRLGWKVRRWIADPSAVPVYYAPLGQWCVLSADTPRRTYISHAEAERMMLAAYGPEGIPK